MNRWTLVDGWADDSDGNGRPVVKKTRRQRRGDVLDAATAVGTALFVL
jgi:hypothetical protein